jgi:beta-mannosidase
MIRATARSRPTKIPPLAMLPGLLAERTPVTTGWRFARSEPDRFATPDELSSEKLDWQEATVPCTVASALRAQTGSSAPAALDFDETDFWFRVDFDGSSAESGPVELVCHGLATLADLWLNGRALGRVENMFVRTTFDLTDHLEDENTLWICFRALGPHLRQKRPRARWRALLAPERNLRFVRTTLFGRMESWNPPIPVVGPWRAIELVSKRPLDIVSAELLPTLEGDAGLLDVDILLRHPAQTDPASLKARICVGTTDHPLSVRAEDDTSARITGRVRIDSVEPWWPHTHGAPRLHPVTLTVGLGDGETSVDLPPVGFRRIELIGPPGPDFDLRINGESVFFRGTCWTPIDPLALDAPADMLRAALEQARDAGMNMLRVAGTMVYESDDFYAICDELGLMVWQDFMFATFDYPADDPGFLASVREEATQFLSRTRPRACLAVLCGNSEGQQQPAMLGLPPESWASELFDSILPALCQTQRPDVPYWPSTPSGGALPFHPGAGTSHYFGVGAYHRPLHDALLARPRFITECLAFAHLPDRPGLERLDQELAIEASQGEETDRSRRRAPRDRGADWDFTDVLDGYIEKLFEAEPDRLRREDPERYEALARATSAEVLYQVQSLWRRPASGCHGAIIWLHRDPWPCAGWGVIDVDGRPKSAYAGLRRAWKPVTVSILDDGLNGLVLMAYNDRGDPLEAEIEIELMRFDGRAIAKSRAPLSLASRSSVEIPIDRFLGGFVDSSYSYRFGPPGFDLCLARLHAHAAIEGAEPLAECVHLVSPCDASPNDEIGLRAEWIASSGRSAILEIAAERFARNVSIEFDEAQPADDFFHLAPGRPRRIEVRADASGSIGTGCVRALNAPEGCILPAPIALATATLDEAGGL